MDVPQQESLADRIPRLLSSLQRPLGSGESLGGAGPIGSLGIGRSPFWEQGYHADLCEDAGQPIVPARVALGALLVKERLGLTDRETVETIQENPYMQFFLGMEEFSQDRPFDASLMVASHKHFGRKRFGEDGIRRMAEAIALASLQKQEEETGPKTETESKPESEDASDPPANQGKLIADATCAPAALCC